MACLLAYAPMVAAYAGDGTVKVESRESMIMDMLRGTPPLEIIFLAAALIASIFLTLRSTKGNVHGATPLFVLLPFFVAFKLTMGSLSHVCWFIAKHPIGSLDWYDVIGRIGQEFWTLNIGLFLCLPAFLIVVWRLLRADGRA